MDEVRRWLEWGSDGRVVGNFGAKHKGSGQWPVAARGNQEDKSGVGGMLLISSVRNFDRYKRWD
jgi:hypothetical protein